jgi:hypothetical protein
MIGPRLRAAVVLSLLLPALWPGSADGHLRYLLFADLRERYNSRVFGTEAEGQASWDVITELEPGFRLYYFRPLNMTALSYRLALQIFTRTPNPDSPGPLVGYSNTADLQHSRRIGPRTEWSTANHFLQGTENSVFTGRIDDNGVYQASRLGTGARTISDSLVTGISHAFNATWRIQSQLTGQISRSRMVDVSGETLPPTHAYGAALDNQLEWSLGNHTVLFRLNDSATWDAEETECDPPQEGCTAAYPVLGTYLAGAAVGWRWNITPFWTTEIAGGAEYHYYERIQPPPPPCPGQCETDYENGVSPLAAAQIIYQRPPFFQAGVHYAHRWTRHNELQYTTSAETDEAGLQAFYLHGDWRFELGGYFLYLRNNTRVPGIPIEGDTKAFNGEATISYLFNPHVSVEAGYAVQGVIDQPLPEQPQATPGQPQPALERSPVAHIAMVGVSVIWPAPSGSASPHLRRASQAEPLFHMEGGEESADTEAPQQITTTDEQQRRRRPSPGLPPLPPPVGQEEEEEEQQRQQQQQEQEEEPPLPDRSNEDDYPSYYSWPR